MDMNAFYGILIPFIGTSAGAACVFFMKKDLNAYVAAVSNRFCSRGDGSGFDMEPFNPGDRSVSGNGKIFICFGTDRFLDRGTFSADAGSHRAASASAQ